MEFLKKWGILIITLFNVMIFFSTCGTKSKIEKVEKRLNVLLYNDSLQGEINSIDREILLNETSREVVYNWNAIVRTTERPDDVMNKYNLKIKELEKDKQTLKNAKK
jgi:hypothetical protein